MLDASNIVQAASGNSGTFDVLSVEPTFGSAVVGDNALFLAVAFPGQTGSVGIAPGQWVGGGLGGGGGGGGYGACYFFSSNAIEGETAVALADRSTTDAMAWTLLEVSGVMSVHYDPNTFNNIGWDITMSDFGYAFEVAVIDITCPVATDSGDEIILCSVAYRTPSGTPSAFSSIADIAGGQPGTWTRYASSEATSRASGDNVRLDSFYRFSGGEQAVFDARLTYAAAAPTGAGMYGAIQGFRAWTVEQQQTRGRAATNSMI